MNNEEYALSIGAKKGTKEFERCMERLASYGDHKWWLSDDPKERAYYQVMEPVQVTNWKQHGQDLKILLGRMPDPDELILDEFKQEVERAWKYDVGCISEAEAKDRSQANRKRILDIAIEKASPEILQEAIHLAGELCLCSNCVARKNAKYTRKKRSFKSKKR